jgi:Glycosyl hydrolase family 26
MKLKIVFIVLLVAAIAEAQIAKRSNYGALLEPKKGVLHGAGQDPAGFLEYVGAVEKDQHPIIYMTYLNLLKKEKLENYSGFLIDLLKDLPADVLPQIGLNFVAGKDNGSGQDKDVAAGIYDENIQLLVTELRKFNRPVFIRIGYEFEGGWNGYKPETYKVTFVKIAKAIKEAKLQVATVWCSGGSAIPHTKMMEYYPGDEWVDWWGVDIFGPKQMAFPSLFEFLNAADSHKKPVMIGESTPRGIGVHDGIKSWEQWYKPYFDLIYKNPQIKAFCYINWDWAYWSDKLGFPWHNWKDARIQLNEYVNEQYRIELKNKIFVHSNLKK